MLDDITLIKFNTHLLNADYGKVMVFRARGTKINPEFKSWWNG